MLSRFNYGTIAAYKAMEDIKNNDIYIIDSDTRMIRKPRDCDEWLTCQLVYVYNVPKSGKPDGNYIINKGEECRCWLGYLVI
jgi:hypothetical protein